MFKITRPLTVIKSIILPLALVFSVTGTVSAATPEKPWKFDSNLITYYNDGSNSFYTGIWDTAASRWNGTGSVLMSEGTNNNFRAGNKSVTPTKNEDWDGITYTSYSNGKVTSTRAWVNTYYTTQSRYSTSIVEGIATHEFGHALGLAHNDNEASVMLSYTFNSNGTLARTNASPTSADKLTMKNKYGYIIAKTEADSTQLDSSKPIVVFDASWAFGYRDYKTLANDVDLIVEGQVVKENGVKKTAKEDYESYRTESIFNVKNVFKGDISLKDKDINVIQLGGIDQDASVISDDTTPLKLNDSTILFLKNNEDGTYHVVNEDESIFINENYSIFSENGGDLYKNQKNGVILSREDLINSIK